MGLFAQILVYSRVSYSLVSVLRIRNSTFKTCGLNYSVVNITCAKKIEKALLDYIYSVDANAEIPAPRGGLNKR